MNGAAIVLCGGQSRRMGRSKATLPFGNETLLQRVVRLVANTTDTIVVVAAPVDDQPIVDIPDWVTVARDPALGKGPLQGIVTGMAALPDEVDLVYTTAVDVPFVSPHWIEYLAEQIKDYDLIMPFVGGRYHPLAAIYRRSRVLPVGRLLIHQGRLRPPFLMESLHSRIVLEDEMERVDPGLRTLRNLNTPEEYHAALSEAGFG